MFNVVFLEMEWWAPFAFIGIVALIVFGIRESIKDEKAKTRIRRSDWQYKRVAKLKIGADRAATEHKLRYCDCIKKGYNEKGLYMIYRYDSVSNNMGTYKHRSYTIYSNHVFLQFDKNSYLINKIMNFDYDEFNKINTSENNTVNNSNKRRTDIRY